MNQHNNLHASRKNVKNVYDVKYLTKNKMCECISTNNVGWAMNIGHIK